MKLSRYKKKHGVYVLALCLLLICVNSSISLAAAGGAFAIKYPGNQSCREFVAANRSSGAENALFLGWLNGYLTGFNRYKEETVDVAPWQGLRLLTGLLLNHCQQNPSQTFLGAVDAMAAALFPNRLKANSELVTIEGEGKTLQLYRSILMRVQQSLAELGYYGRQIDGQFDDATRSALRAYQQDKAVPVTGLPDQETLYQLFR